MSKKDFKYSWFDSESGSLRYDRVDTNPPGFWAGLGCTLLGGLVGGPVGAVVAGALFATASQVRKASDHDMTEEEWDDLPCRERRP